MGMHVSRTTIERRDLVLKMAACRNRQAALFLRTIQFWRDLESMPVNVLRYVRVVDDVDGSGNSFSHTDEWAWRRSVIRGGSDCVSGCNLDPRPLYAQRHIGWAAGVVSILPILAVLKGHCDHSGDKCAACGTRPAI